MALILILCLMANACVGAEGILPSLTDTIGKPMLSLGEALSRYPDEEMLNADGSNTEVFRGVTEEDFNTFSVYLSEQGAILADYQAAETSFSASIQVDGKTISFTYDTQTLDATVTYPEGTYDEWLDYAKTQFASAIELLNSEDTDEALAVIFSIPGYSEFKPVAEYFAANPEIAMAAQLAPFKTVGSIVTFGTYPQTASGTDSTPIEWLVLDYDAANNRTLLISRYGLDAQQYSAKQESTLWETSSVRKWLNDEFYNVAFANEEKQSIIPTRLDNKTDDRLFLLSRQEAFGLYFKSDEDRVCVQTEYALSVRAAHVKNGYITPTDAGPSGWMLRSSTHLTDYLDLVCYDGSIGACQTAEEPVLQLLRPALWLKLDALTYTNVDSEQYASSEQPTDEPSEIAATMQKGSKGENVKRLQQALIDQGYLAGSADGQFGKMTETAVKAAQEAFGLEPTGIADAALLEKLYN